MIKQLTGGASIIGRLKSHTRSYSLVTQGENPNRKRHHEVTKRPVAKWAQINLVQKKKRKILEPCPPSMPKTSKIFLCGKTAENRNMSGKMNRKTRVSSIEHNRHRDDHKETSPPRRTAKGDPWSTPEEKKAGDKTWEGKSLIPDLPERTEAGKALAQARRKAEEEKKKKKRDTDGNEKGPGQRDLKRRTVGVPIPKQDQKCPAGRKTSTRVTTTEADPETARDREARPEIVKKRAVESIPTPFRKRKTKTFQSTIMPTCPPLGSKMNTTTPPPPTRPKAKSVTAQVHKNRSQTKEWEKGGTPKKTSKEDEIPATPPEAYEAKMKAYTKENKTFPWQERDQLGEEAESIKGAGEQNQTTTTVDEAEEVDPSF